MTLRHRAPKRAKLITVKLPSELHDLIEGLAIERDSTKSAFTRQLILGALMHAWPQEMDAYFAGLAEREQEELDNA
jgi:predicted transcriptional regulator